ncbi:FBP domain-containing protein [Oerskovia turbata]
MVHGLPSTFDALAWDRPDYLGWRDPCSPLRVYLVALFSAARPGSDRRGSLDTLGIYVCVDLDCHTSVHSTPMPGPLDPPADEIVRGRRDGLRDRTSAFVRSVVMQ